MSGELGRDEDLSPPTEKLCIARGSIWRDQRLLADPLCPREVNSLADSTEEGVCTCPSSAANESLFLRLRAAADLFLNDLMATKMRTLSPTFLIPNSCKTFWSHSRRLSPLKLFALKSASYWPHFIDRNHSPTCFSSQALIESAASYFSEKSDSVGLEYVPLVVVTEFDAADLWVEVLLG